jgi:hypothetical protein
MKKYIITSLLLITILSIDLFAQTNDVWKSFVDAKTGLFGYKDKDGNIKVEPKYLGFMIADKFSDITAVMEEDNSSYYITKNGKQVGKDSVFVFDNGFDCESEGYIRFRDPITQKVGIFNGEGNVVIPADYEVLTKMINGLAIGLKGAHKYYPNNDTNDEHWGYEGGTFYLIDSANNILANDFPYELNLDFHSIIVEGSPSLEAGRVSFPGINGKFYSFVNNEKLFDSWFHNDFLKHLSKEDIIKNSYPIMVHWSDEERWVSINSVEFVEKNYDLFLPKLLELKNGYADYFYTIDDFLIITEETIDEFDKYLDNCGQLKITQYPIINVLINHKAADDISQDSFTFFKTENGFKLIDVEIQDPHLK